MRQVFSCPFTDISTLTSFFSSLFLDLIALTLSIWHLFGEVTVVDFETIIKLKSYHNTVDSIFTHRRSARDPLLPLSFHKQRRQIRKARNLPVDSEKSRPKLFSQRAAQLFSITHQFRWLSPVQFFSLVCSVIKNSFKGPTGSSSRRRSSNGKLFSP